MKNYFVASQCVWFAMTGGLSAEPIIFGPVKSQPGESIRLVAHSEAPEGTFTRGLGAESKTGKINISRHRELHWTFRQPEPDGSLRGIVKAVRLSSSKSVKLDGKEEISEDVSSLTGKLFTLTKAPAGEWEFKLDGSLPMADAREDIDELKVYLKRQWFPEKPVEPGDSWEFDPKWVKMVIEKDLGESLTIGTMTLRQVRRSNARSTATIDISIRSSDEGFQKDGSLTEASVDLKGEMVVNLDTMLDESLELRGTISMTKREVKDTTKLSLPVRIIVTKTLFKGGGIP